VNDIFSRIDKRLSDEQNRVNQINQRVSSCKNKVEKVKGSLHN